MRVFRSFLLRVLFLTLLPFDIEFSLAQDIRLSSYSLNSGGHASGNEQMGLKASLSQPVIGLVHPGGGSNSQGFWHVYASVRKVSTPLRPYSGTDNKLLIYPNPFYELLYLDLAMAFAPLHCMVVDMSGKVLERHILGGGKTALNLANLPSGPYLIRVLNEHLLYAQLILKL